MKKSRPYSFRYTLFFGVVCCMLALVSCKEESSFCGLRKDFIDPPREARPWVFWYWINAAVSKEGITADLAAMKEAGIGGAYLMPIRGASDPPLYEPSAEQLTPNWWGLIMHALEEADRLGLKIGMHASDGFALAGGPWISPELSMQKLVWTELQVVGGQESDIFLEQPETVEGYFIDIAVYAWPTGAYLQNNNLAGVPEVSSSIPGINPGFLAGIDPRISLRTNPREVFRSEDSCWIQYSYKNPFTCCNITIRTRGYNYPSHRLWVQCSDNGIDFRTICRLDAPRHGWQEESEEVTHAIKPTTAKYFRFLYDRTGLEPGAEDLEMAKWSPTLKISGIHLSGSPRIHQYRGKTAALWRISPSSSPTFLPDSLCIPESELLDISDKLDAGGRLNWVPPDGQWTVLRMGHTSTGKTNYTGGGGLGLECDKFNPEAARLQFENWFGAVLDYAESHHPDPDLVNRVLKVFHVDSWECGSQNWSPVFKNEFIERRGYDPLPYLPAMAGIPLHSASETEKFLHDIRITISELLVDNFYKVLAASAEKYNCSFSAECTAPTMTGDGMMHYHSVDIPMGEFWLNSPTHDKPNDMLDAISGAHIYNKQIIQAEAFTELRMRWEEHPGMLKKLGDRSFAQGINRLAFHVFAHNPWMDRKPGMTLSRIGLYFQRDQTWWKPGRAWIEYITRCQAMLQKGSHRADIAVFTGEEIPRRSVLPDRLVPILPGIFGAEIVHAEKNRLMNTGLPQREMPEGVYHSANMADPWDWIDPLKGYKYDSFNPDVLLNLASVENGRIVLPGGNSYGLLVIPASRRMDPGGNILSEKLAAKILDLAREGAMILMPDTLLTVNGAKIPETSSQGMGRIVVGPWKQQNFSELGMEPDFLAFEMSGERAEGIAWTHRDYGGTDIYFISNQEDSHREILISLRGGTYSPTSYSNRSARNSPSRHPDIYDPLSGEIIPARNWKIEDGRTEIPLMLEPRGSLFIVLERKSRTKSMTQTKSMNKGPNMHRPVHLMDLDGEWELQFDPSFGGPDSSFRLKELRSWHLSDDPGVRYYSGTAVYRQTFPWQNENGAASRFWLDVEEIHNLAEVFLNGKSCGVIWTEPYRIEISDELIPGENKLELHVTNTWANRLIGDFKLPAGERITWTNETFPMEGRSLLKAGLSGQVSIYKGE